MFGWGYVKDVCIALFQKEQEEKTYQYYVAECARIITENTAMIASYLSHGEAECKFISLSLRDMMHPKQEDNRTAEEVIEDIGNKLQKIGGETT